MILFRLQITLKVTVYFQSPIYFLPFCSRYTVSVIPFVWKDLQNQLTSTKLLQCDPKSKNDMEPFFMKVSTYVLGIRILDFAAK
jgi:hypothetical protein